jgi:uncharacterized lipoprotein YajG
MKKFMMLVGLPLLLLTGCSAAQTALTTSSSTSSDPVKSLYSSNGVTVLEDTQTGDLIYQTDKGVATALSAMFSSNQIKNLESKGYVSSDSPSQSATNDSSTIDTVKSLYTSNGVTVLEDVPTGNLIYETDAGVTVVSTLMFGDNQIKNLESKGYVAVK